MQSVLSTLSVATTNVRGQDQKNKPFVFTPVPSTDIANPLCATPVDEDQGQIQVDSLQKCELRRVDVHGGLHVSWMSSDAQIFAAGGGNKKLTLYSIATAQIIGQMPCDSILRASAASPVVHDASSGEFTFIVGCESGQFALLSYTSTQDWAAAWESASKLTCENQGSVNAATFSRDGTLVAVGWIMGSVHVYRITEAMVDEPPKHTLKLSAGKINSGCLQFSANFLWGSSVHMTNDDPSEVKVWAIHEGFKEHRILQLVSPVWAVAVAPGESAFAIGTQDGAVRLYSGMTDVTPWPMIPAGKIGAEGPVGGVSSLAFSFGKNPTLLAIGWRSGDFAVYDIDTVAQVGSFLHGGTNNGFSLHFSPDDSVLAAGGGNAEVELHRLRKCLQLRSVSR